MSLSDSFDGIGAAVMIQFENRGLLKRKAFELR